MYCPTDRTCDGLGFPFIPLIAAGVSTAISALRSKGKDKVTSQDAENAVRQIYLELLEREPDPGSQGFADCLVNGSCDVDFVRTEILKSPEYHDLQVRKATAAYAPESPGYTPTAGGGGSSALPSVSSLSSMSIGGIPLPYLVGGVLLFSLLKGRRR